jgi:hypothetical protein
MAIEDELTHWYKKDDGTSARSTFRIESDAPTEHNGYPKDGIITVRIMNGAGALGFRLNPEEALKVSTILMTAAKDAMNKKRVLWQKHGD